MKGGSQYPSLMIITITSFFSIFLVLITMGIFVYIIDIPVRGDVEGTIIYDNYKQAKTEDILLTFLDCTYNKSGDIRGRRMGELLALAVKTGGSGIRLLDNNQWVDVDVGEASEAVLREITREGLLDVDYRLSFSTPTIEIFLKGKEEISESKKAEALITANDENIIKRGWLKLEVRGEMSV